MALVLGSGRSLLAAGDKSPSNADSRDLIGAVKRLESALGFHRNKNFSRESTRTVAVFRCYYTGKLELPDSYDKLRLKKGSKDGCRLDPAKYDIFFYPIEAVASGRTPVTTSLAHESPERVLVVVPHEDFHQDPELRRLPAPLTEAAATLVGFLTAREAARQQFGAKSEVFQRLHEEPDIFLRKSAIVNRYYTQISRLYAAVRAGEISKQQAVAKKQTLYRSLQQECTAISPDPKSFNKCLAANNNAGLAFDATYTRYYPLMVQLSQARGGDLKATIDALKEALRAKSEAEAVANLERAVTGDK